MTKKLLIIMFSLVTLIAGCQGSVKTSAPQRLIDPVAEETRQIKRMAMLRLCLENQRGARWRWREYLAEVEYQKYLRKSD